jgi:phenylpropionate dioxygenase-like ring-hydroxylating dioxygenase large terminal subunit
MFLKDYWYAAAWATEIGQKLTGRVVLNEPVVFFRKKDGTPVALEDRCAHRRAPLSLGHLIDDQVQCVYHGLVYDCTGKCVRVPGQKQVSETFGVRQYPVRERHKFIWIWMGDPALADDSKIPAFTLLDDPSWATCADYFHVPANYMLIVDNLCDLSHVAYLHAGYTGNEPIGELAEVDTTHAEEPGNSWVRGERWTYDVVPAQTYATFGHYIGNVDRWQKYEFRPPGIFEIDNGAAAAGSGVSKNNPEGGKERWGFRVYHAITPESEKSSHYFWVVMHEAIGDAAALKIFHQQCREVLTQDFDIFVGQQRIVDLAPDAPTKTIAADGGLVRARRIMSKLLEAEAAETGSLLFGRHD